MRSFVLVVALPALAALAACGGQVNGGTGTSNGGSTSSAASGKSSAASSGASATSTSTTGSQSTSTGSTGSQSSSSGSAGPHGCTGSADCGGGTCAPLTPGGYQVCLSTPPQATSCQQPMSPADQCCTTADCATKGGGSCYASMNLQFCGGAQIQQNLCVTDLCKTDGDCVKNSAPAICVPAGSFDSPGAFCLNAWCKTDADCIAKAGGACLLIGNNPCCKYPQPDGLGCVYPGDCTKDADCPMNQACHIDTTTGESGCTQSIGGCPG